MTSEFAYILRRGEWARLMYRSGRVPARHHRRLQRVASHLLWLGTWCMDMGGALGGGATIFLYCIRERELILDLFESLVGHVCSTGSFRSAACATTCRRGGPRMPQDPST